MQNEDTKPSQPIIENREIYRLITENSPDGIVVSGADNKISYVSPSYVRLFGYSESEELNRSSDGIFSVIHPDDRDTVYSKIFQATKQKQPGLFFEYRMKHKDGYYLWREDNMSFKYDSLGNYLGAYTICRDISDRKKLEESLYESNERFYGYFNIPTLGVAITSPEKGWVEINDRICTMLGYDRNEITKLTWSEMTYPEDIATDEELFNQVLTGKIEQYAIDKRFIKKDKNIIWTKLSVSCVRKSDRTVKYIIATLDDITAAKKSQEIFASNTALLEAQLNATIDGVLIVDLNQKRLLINNKMVALFNVPDEILEDKNDDLLLEHIVGLVKDSAHFLDKVTYLYTHPTETSRDQIEFKNGMVLDRYSAPVIDVSGKNLGRIWTFRDITDSKKSEESLQEKLEEIEKINTLMIGRELKMTELKKEIFLLKQS